VAQNRWPLVPVLPSSGGFTDLEHLDVRKTLTADLMPVADELRDLYTEFGLRLYIVRIVRTRWSEGRRGVGTELLLDERALLPTPRIRDLSLREVTTEAGLEEIGADLVVDQISPDRYTEDMLLGRDADDKVGQGPPPDVSFFYEIEFRRQDGRPARLRRFNISGAPFLAADRFMWSVRLTKALGERTRDGAPGG